MTSGQLADKLLRHGLPACTKTIQRDIQYMLMRMDAPVIYDERLHAYRLTDSKWQYPIAQLASDQAFIGLFISHILTDALPTSFSDDIASIKGALIAACAPEKISTDALSSVMMATASKVLPEATIFDTILAAWRDSHCLKISYENDHAIETSRKYEPHAIFLYEGAWYIRGYCHLRNAVRCLAFHRCKETIHLPQSFQRNDRVLAGVRHGCPFDYNEIPLVRVRCTPDKAKIIQERQWFPGQQIATNADGSLTLTFQFAPKPPLIRWLLSFAPHLTLQHPQDLRQEINDLSAELLKNHTQKLS